MENSLPGCCIPGCAGKIWLRVVLEDSVMPPFRLVALLPALDPLELPFPLLGVALVAALPLPLPFPFTVALPGFALFAASAAHAAMAIEYASSPVEQPALHMRSVAG